MSTTDTLLATPNPLARHYSRSRVSDRILLTGHSFQASPDVAEAAHAEAWLVAARLADERLEALFEASEGLRQRLGALLEADPLNIALGCSVHDLLVRFLSGLPLGQRPRLVTTSAEYPSVARQLVRLQEAGVELVVVEALPAASVAERLAAQVNDRTAAVLVSSVFFDTGHLVTELDALLTVCQRFGAELFIDACQSLNVQPLSVREDGLEGAFIAAAGNRYLQCGDGLAFLHVPPGCAARPVVTGWYGCFDPLLDNPAATPLAYGDHFQRYEGSNRDHAAEFRALAVLDFFRRERLTVAQLSALNQRQRDLLVEGVRALDADPGQFRLTGESEEFGGFLSFHAPQAARLVEQLRDVGVHTDYRGSLLRLGPAPYLSLEQLEDAVQALGEALRSLS